MKHDGKVIINKIIAINPVDITRAQHIFINRMIAVRFFIITADNIRLDLSTSLLFFIDNLHST